MKTKLMEELYEKQGTEEESMTDFKAKIGQLMNDDILVPEVPIYAVPTGCELETSETYRST